MRDMKRLMRPSLDINPVGTNYTPVQNRCSPNAIVDANANSVIATPFDIMPCLARE